MSGAVAEPVGSSAAASAEAAPAARSGFDLTVRAAVAVVLGALALTAAWIGGFWFMALWFAAAALALWEWQTLIGGERLIARLALGVVTDLAVAPLALHGAAVWSLVALALGAAATGALAGPTRSARIWAGTGVVYAGAILAAPTLLRASPAFGFAAVLWLFAVVWGTDTLAFFGGRLIGGPKLWRRVSPGKTWSGAVVGALAGAAAGARGRLARRAGGRASGADPGAQPRRLGRSANWATSANWG